MLYAFLIMTISVTLGFLLAMVLAFALMLNPTVMKFYVKYIYKKMAELDNTFDELD